MALSTELISQFAKIVVPKEQRPESTTVTGTAKEYAGKIYVQIDGSDQLTPIASSTVGMKDGDKVTVQIKNHSATITGNASDPSAGKSYADDINNKVDDVSDQISEFEIIIADKVDVDDLNAVNGRIDNLVSENVTITGKLDAVEADIGELTADNVTINGKLDAADAEIENLKVTKLDVDIADMKYATIENLEATNADIHNLKADYGEFKDLTTEKFTAVDADIADLDAKKLSAEQADLKYANIDFANIGKAAIENFFSKSGMIGDLVVGDGTITGTLVGVTIKGDLIEGGTVKADKLVVQGEDGLYYKLNVTGETVAAEQTEYNSLNGSIITAKSITAEKISVNDLVAFGATIGGFHITDSSLYSGVKESATNTTRGVFMNDDGEFSVGDSNNYFRYFYDAETSTYKLEISAAQIKLGTGGQTIDDYVDNKINESIGDIDLDVSVGGRNLIRDSQSFTGTKSEADNLTIKPTVSDYGREALQNAEYMTISFRYTVPENSTGVIKLIPRSAPVPTEEAADPQSDSDYSETYLNPIPTWPSLVGVTTGSFSYTTKVNEVHKLNFVDLSAECAGVATDGEVTVENVKVEIGKTATDWTPAPEDMATSGEIDNIQGDLDEVTERVGTAEVNIDGINQMIQNLVVGENGESMMTQTEDGWVFDMSSIQSSVSDALDSVSEIHGDITDTNAAVDSLKNEVDSLKETNAYVRISQDENGDPCIILGREDSDFQLRITNTSMDFMQGTEKIAYLTNHQLYIQSSVVTDELKIGAGTGYIWQKRGNNHLGLRYVTS